MRESPVHGIPATLVLSHAGGIYLHDDRRDVIFLSFIAAKPQGLTIHAVHQLIGGLIPMIDQIVERAARSPFSAFGRHRLRDPVCKQKQEWPGISLMEGVRGNLTLGNKPRSGPLLSRVCSAELEGFSTYPGM